MSQFNLPVKEMCTCGACRSCTVRRQQKVRRKAVADLARKNGLKIISCETMTHLMIRLKLRGTKFSDTGPEFGEAKPLREFNAWP